MNYVTQIDSNILLWIQEHLRSDLLTPIWKAITSLGNAGWFFLAVGILLYAMKKTRPAGVQVLLAIMIGALITNLILKNVVARSRPFDTFSEMIPLITKPRDYSFPSGHTCAAFAFAISLWQSCGKKWGIPAVILASLVAFSRLYLGVHYPTDVLAGLVIGMIAAVLSAVILRKRKE